MRIGTLLMVLGVLCTIVHVQGSYNAFGRHHKNTLSYVMDVFVHDGLAFNINLFTTDSLKIAAATVPVYAAAVGADKPVNNLFYCGKHHHNCHQPPAWLHKIIHDTTPPLLIGLAACAFFKSKPHLQRTAEVFACSLPFTFVWKKILKKMVHSDVGIRPRNGNFSRHTKYFGGCPSGHMIQITYAALFFGRELGVAWGVPLGLYGASMFGDFVATNRHTISQLIAGVGFGVMCAFASDKVLDDYYCKNWSCEMQTDSAGKQSICLSYVF